MSLIQAKFSPLVKCDSNINDDIKSLLTRHNSVFFLSTETHLESSNLITFAPTLRHNGTWHWCLVNWKVYNIPKWARRCTVSCNNWWCFVCVLLSSPPGPFLPDDEYLVVADFYKQNVYQLKPDSGEVRALPLSPCHPFSLAFDPSINGLYMTCAERSNTDVYYRIRKKTFDGKINRVIYYSPRGTSETSSICNV